MVSVNDLDVHILEAFPNSTTDQHIKPPLLVLLHGFPEIAYSWRKVMIPLAESGFAVVAPDQRGYGQTRERGQLVRTIAFQEDLAPYRMFNMVNDIVDLVHTLGYDSAAAIVGHDFGSPVAAHCALMHPELFKSVVLMSAPFGGPMSPGSSPVDGGQTMFQKLDNALAELDPPRKHYMMYYSTPSAAQDMLTAPGGMHSFLRACYHVKSADWEGNKVHPLEKPSPDALSALPHYYIMRLDQTMPESVLPDAPSAETIAQNTWLPDAELAVYVSQYSATGFQGGLNSYRCLTEPCWSKDLEPFADKQIGVPAMFIAGAQDWGTYQFPGAAEKMKINACRNMRDSDFILIEGAGHWVQQEQPSVVVDCILRFVRENK